MLNRVQRAASGSIGVLLRLKIGLEDRLQDQHYRHLHYPIADRWNAQRSLLSIRLWYVYPADRLSLVGLGSQAFRQFAQPTLPAIRFDVVESLPVNPRSPTVGPATLVGMRSA